MFVFGPSQLRTEPAPRLAQGGVVVRWVDVWPKSATHRAVAQDLSQRGFIYCFIIQRFEKIIGCNYFYDKPKLRIRKNKREIKLF